MGLWSMGTKHNEFTVLLEDFEKAWSDLVLERYPDGDPLYEVVRYAALGQGKRIRPLLMLLSAQAVTKDESEHAAVLRDVLPAACALEMIHTYSLVHDDLPCMDDDKLRRGRPTTHVVFDEARALLAGDTLLTDAFSLLAEAYREKPEMCVALVMLLAEAAGGGGMIRGQALDLHWTGADHGTQAVSKETLDVIHRLKTGRLLQAATQMGAVIAGSTKAQSDALCRFGADLGLAFQICDDILDLSGNTGKSVGKDQAHGKLTYIKVMTLVEAKTYAAIVTSRAMGHLDMAPGIQSEALIHLANELLARDK